MKVYFDNAATTPLDPAVFEEMKPFMLENFGNPSSIHSHGRQVRAAIERSRKKIADLLSTSPSEIFFTSGGTEADNTAIINSVAQFEIEQIISSPLEHHAVLHTIDFLSKTSNIEATLLNIDEKGNLDLNQLEALLQNGKKTLVSLMHANNEIGNLLDLEKVGSLCKEHGAIFHSDTVQSMGHYIHNLEELPVDFVVGSAHKFHGPKGVGFLYINHEKKIAPFVHGGAQERNMRGGTENVYGIIGLAKALELAYEEMDTHRNHIEKVKSHMITSLKAALPEVNFHGNSADINNSLYTVLNVSLPESDIDEMLLFNLDIEGISASGGSACSSGSSLGSHVLDAIKADARRNAVRFSFSRNNTVEEVDYVVSKLSELYNRA